MKIHAALLVILALGLGPAHAATPTLGNWVVTKTYHPDGPPTCVLRFPSAKGAPVLTLDERKKGGATFTLAALPPLLAGEMGVIRGISVKIGGWSRADLKGAWVRGSDDTNSRITFPVNVSVASIGPHLARGNSLTIAFKLANGQRSFPFTLDGAAAPTADTVACR
jgi:hypothetical protein